MEELDRCAPDGFVDKSPVLSRRVDAGFGKLVPALVVAFVDEDLVIHRTGNDRELSVRDMGGGEGRVRTWRRLCIPGTDSYIGGNRHPTETP